MKITANAKINLSLNITGKRSDGYHLLDMVMLEIPFGDIIEINKSDSIKIKANGWLPENNTLAKACELFFEYTDIKGGADIFLRKKIPSGAGMGGGSSDGACVLKALNEIYDAGIPNDKLKEIALNIGADVPFFIEGGCARARGIGEELMPVYSALKGYCLLAKPYGGVSTPKAYKLCDEMPSEGCDMQKVIEYIEAGDIKSLGKTSANMLEPAAKKLCPEISIVESAFSGSDFTLMTGSGSCVFWIYANKRKGLKQKKVW